MSAWFRYERDFANRWRPAVLYGKKPVIPMHDLGRFTAAVEVPGEFLSEDGSPMFGKLTTRFPAPKDEDS